MPKQYFPLFPTFVTVMASHHHTSGINPQFKVSGRKQKPSEYFINGLNSGNRFILSECITLLESTHPEKRKVAEAVLNTIPFQNETTIRIGITGSPGVGKSTFIEAFGLYLISQHHRPAILAIDPSSQINKGSILGDNFLLIRMRMLDLLLRVLYSVVLQHLQRKPFKCVKQVVLTSSLWKRWVLVNPKLK